MTHTELTAALDAAERLDKATSEINPRKHINSDDVDILITAFRELAEAERIQRKKKWTVSVSVVKVDNVIRSLWSVDGIDGKGVDLRRDTPSAAIRAADKWLREREGGDAHA